MISTLKHQGIKETQITLLFLFIFLIQLPFITRTTHSRTKYHSFPSPQMINSPNTFPFSSSASKFESCSPQLKATSPFSSSSSSSSSSSLSSSPLAESVARAPAEVEKIPRPLNSFMIFRLEKQRDIVEKCPGANHRDISKIISKWWKELGKFEKQWYIAEAEKRKLEHKAL